MAAQCPLALPGLLDGDRKAGFALLLVVTVGEVFAQVAAAGALKAVLVGATSGPWAAISLAASGLGAAWFAWGRAILGERFGLRYVRDVRQVLARHAICVASSGGPGRFGTIAIRMTGDLSAIKDWASKGVCGGLAATLGLLGAVVSAWWTAGLAGLGAVAVGPILAILVCLAMYAVLVGCVRERRREKGRLSAKIGDMLLGASSTAAYGAEARAIRPVDRAADAAIDAQLKETVVSGVLQLPALLTVPLGAATAVVMMMYGLAPTGGAAGWAALLFALSLAALAVSLGIGAVVQFAERRIAVAKLHDLVDLANATSNPVPPGEIRLKGGRGGRLSVNGATLLEAGGRARWSRRSITPALESILSAASSVHLDDVCACDIAAIDWARRLAYVGPRRGLARGRIDLVLAAKRKASPEAMAEAFGVASLPLRWLDDSQLIDPQSTAFDEWTLSRLRLARALCHKPRIVIVDDPWLTDDKALMERLDAWCRERAVSLAVIEENAPPHLSIASSKF